MSWTEDDRCFSRRELLLTTALSGVAGLALHSLTMTSRFPNRYIIYNGWVLRPEDLDVFADDNRR